MVGLRSSWPPIEPALRDAQLTLLLVVDEHLEYEVLSAQLDLGEGEVDSMVGHQTMIIPDISGSAKRNA